MADPGRVPAPHRQSRLPALGPRGEGWVIGQGVLLALVAVLGLPGLADLPPVDGAGWALLGLGLVLLAGGVGIGLAGIRALGRHLTAVPRPKRDASLVETGIYGAIRHPLYVAVVAAALGWAVAMGSIPSAVVAIVLGVWLDAKARREEDWLLEAYPEYAAYRRRTSRFIPRVY
jgi:protein-S-isoprenylcysteine O-methyltransferase Ste14